MMVRNFPGADGNKFSNKTSHLLIYLFFFFKGRDESKIAFDIGLYDCPESDINKIAWFFTLKTIHNTVALSENIA